jgi:aryl carrier-like protein
MRKKDIKFLKEVFDHLIIGSSQSMITKILVRRELRKLEDIEDEAKLRASIRKLKNRVKQRVYHATEHLVKKGYIQKTSRTRPHHFHRGKNALEFDALVKEVTLSKSGYVKTKGVAPADREIGEPVRLHEAFFRCNVRIRPSDSELSKRGFTWEKVNDKLDGNVINRQAHVVIRPVGAVFLRETSSKRKRTMYITLPPQEIQSGALRERNALLQDYAQRVVHWLRGKGYGLSYPEQCNEPMKAFGAPEFDNGLVRRVITDKAQVDFSHSKKKAFAEYETRDIVLAETRARLPEIALELLEDVQNIKEYLELGLEDQAKLEKSLKQIRLGLDSIRTMLRDMLKDALNEFKAELKAEMTAQLQGMKSEIIEELRFKPDMKDRSGYA